MAEACASKFEAFARTVLPESFFNPLSQFHNYLTSVVETDQLTGRREVAGGPRGWGKSTTITEGGTLWIVCRNKYIPVRSQYKFILIVSDTASQAEARLFTIKTILQENEDIANLYPEASGVGPLWRRDMIVTRNDVCIAAAGMTSSIRGIRYKNRRPDLIICHERGTLMLHNGTWIPVEAHPSFTTPRVCGGFAVSLCGEPEQEVVTPEHRYYTRSVDPLGATDVTHVAPPQWVEAKDLREHHYIGYPIDTTVEEPWRLWTYKPGTSSARDARGRITDGGGAYAYAATEFLNDSAMWWLIGLWWGDGSVRGKHGLQIIFNKRDTEALARAQDILTRHNIASSLQPAAGTENAIVLCFACTTLNRMLTAWKEGPSKKTPPYWVERLSLDKQAELIRGYVAADGWVDTRGRSPSVRITSIHLPGLRAAKRILARLGVCASIRKGAGPRRETFPNGRTSISQQKYDIRFRNGASKLGYPIPDSTRYRIKNQFIADGCLWSKVRGTQEVADREFCPIHTDGHTYVTKFGLSHNCDDPDSMDTVNSPAECANLEERFTRDLMKCGHKHTDIFVVGTVLGKNALCYKLLNNEDFAAWNGRIFKALETFPTHMELWDAYGDMLKDRISNTRLQDAELFYEQNKEAMDLGGVSNWPEVYSVKDLMREYYLEGRRSFLLEKQNQIVEEEDAYFKPAQYSYYTEAEYETLLRYNPLIYIYVDPTGGKSLTKAATRRSGDSDRFAITVIAKLDNKQFYLVDCVYGQYRQSQQFEQVRKCIEKWDNLAKVHKLTIEDRGDEFYITPMRAYLKANGVHRIVPRSVQNSVPKEERIAMLEPYLDNWTIRLPEDRRRFKGFFDEIEDWPRSQFDDILDSFSGCFFSAYRTFRLRYLNG